MEGLHSGTVPAIPGMSNPYLHWNLAHWHPFDVLPCRPTSYFTSCLGHQLLCPSVFQPVSCTIHQLYDDSSSCLSRSFAIHQSDNWTTFQPNSYASHQLPNVETSIAQQRTNSPVYLPTDLAVHRLSIPPTSQSPIHETSSPSTSWPIHLPWLMPPLHQLSSQPLIRSKRTNRHAFCQQTFCVSCHTKSPEWSPDFSE